jgi:hypothetical protein
LALKATDCGVPDKSVAMTVADVPEPAATVAPVGATETWKLKGPATFIVGEKPFSTMLVGAAAPVSWTATLTMKLPPAK